MPLEFLIGIAIVVLAIFSMFIALMTRYKRCPSDKIMVIYGKVGKKGGETRSAKCIHGGAAFIWPLIQNHAFLDLNPITLDVNLTGALSRQNIRVNIPSTFTVGISTTPVGMTNAAERLLGLNRASVQNLAKDIIFGQLRLVIATMDIEEINSNRDKFLANIAQNLENELQKVGLVLINVNLKDIEDESGYIVALGREAAAKAINEAKIKVAEQLRAGDIGEANANQEKRIKVAEAQAKAKVGEAEALRLERVQTSQADSQAKIGEAEAHRMERVKTASANAEAVEGENQAKITIADSNAIRREREAEAARKGSAAEKVQQAKALQESYQAEKDAETARGERDRATQIANVVVQAEIDKQRIEIEAEAQAEAIRRQARGEADAVYAKMKAEALGASEILKKRADGFNELVRSANNDPKAAAMLMVIDNLQEIAQIQVEAVKNLKIDKVVVWDHMGHGKGGSLTAKFASELVSSLPPIHDLLKNAGYDLPAFMGNPIPEEPKAEDDDPLDIDEIEVE